MKKTAILVVFFLFFSIFGYSQRREHTLSPENQKILLDSVADLLAKTYLEPEKATHFKDTLRHYSQQGRYRGLGNHTLFFAMNRDIRRFFGDSDLFLYRSYAPSFGFLHWKGKHMNGFHLNRKNQPIISHESYESWAENLKNVKAKIGDIKKEKTDWKTLYPEDREKLQTKHGTALTDWYNTDPQEMD